MKIQDLFIAKVTRDIPPVVYFHEQSPQKLKEEVGEYIITGGYPDGDPRARRLKFGIHEQFVHLLRAVDAELRKSSGPELPASWISGFFGSGKSSFAKLLGLSFDGKTLPDGSALVDALIARDESPRHAEFAEAWTQLRARVNPIAVVFDIGGVARDDEQIHAAALRQIQARFGYCSKSHHVADHELKLERDGVWPQFLSIAEKTLKKPWSVAKEEQQAEDHFSHVLHKLDSDRYREPMSWIDSRAGYGRGAGSSVREVVESIDAMMHLRAVGKTLFIVVDEVSQYVHQDDNRMLKLQSFVSELGQRLKGLVWLFATGQQKLEDTSQADNIGKLKDRFPTSLRVHLNPANIHEVVHKRLLAKKKEHEPLLRKLFQDHRPDLKLHGYKCEEITEEDFLEIYPMLPGHVDLLMNITSNLRTRSTRVQGDDHAIRGLLQLLGELFREQKLGDREVGELVTLDAIFEVQHTALESDVQTTLARIFDHADVRDDALAMRAARAVALLELIQEQEPTTAELVARCLYRKLGEGNQVQAVSHALEKLRGANLIAYSEKHGYKIQSSAGQEWERERDDIGITPEQLSDVVKDKLKELMGTPDRPRYKARPFPWAALFSDGRHRSDDRLQDPRDDSNVTVDFRFLRSKDERAGPGWIQKSDTDPLKNRLIWVIGEPSSIESMARDYARSAHMVSRFSARRASLSREKTRLLLEEEARFEDLDKKLKAFVVGAFLSGTMYFRSRPLEPRGLGSTFAGVLTAAAERILPDLYPYFTEVAVTDTELNELLAKTLSGPSTKFLDGVGGLGILKLDAGKYVADCKGAEPSRILQFIEHGGGAAGSTLLSNFGAPPFGYPVDVVRACLAGLLRASKIRIQPEEGPPITSVNDPGTRDLFRKDRDLRRADLFPAKEGAISPRDKVAIRAFFKKHLDLDLDADNDAFADAVYQRFPGKRERLLEIEGLFNQLPGRPVLPQALTRLTKALEDCRRSRQVEETVVAVKKNLDALADGLDLLARTTTELTEEAVRLVAKVASCSDTELAQLRQIEALAGLEEHARAVAEQLSGDRPWRGVKTVSPAIEQIRQRYVELRGQLINRQSAEAEAARKKIKARAGFEKLLPDQVHHVLRPIAEALFDTTPEAVAPALGDMQARFPQRLAAAEEQANERLDDARSKRTDKQVVKVDLGLRGREVDDKEQLKAVLKELEDRILPHLEKKSRVRIV